MGVFNDFYGSGSHSDELWFQGGARLVQNIGSWDSELNSIIGTPGVGLTTGAGFEWRVNNSPIVFFDRSGNVGIGTTAPNGKLNIYADNIVGPAAGNITLDHPTSGGASSLVFTSRSNRLSDYGYITYYDSISTYAFWGTTNENSALVIGTQNDIMNAYSDVVALRGAAADVFGTYSYPSTMIINDSGNVGIGTTTPSYKLDVVGDIRTSGCLLYNGGTLGTCTSDIREKNVLSDFKIENALSKIIQLQPKKYTFKKDNDGNIYVGLIAQEVENILPELVTQDENGYKKIRYGDIQWLMLDAIKELENKINTLQIENKELNQKIFELEQKTNR